MTTELTNYRAPSSLMPQAEWNLLRDQCNVLVKSGFLPKGVDTPEKAMAIALKGHEMGLPPMAAFGGISIVNGKPVVEGQLMLAQILRLVPGAKVEYLERTEKVCRLRALRPGLDWQEFTWTIEQAKFAGLTTKPGPWQSYPRNMLQWRAVADMARAVFPDVVMGAYTQDEHESMTPIDVTPKAKTAEVANLLAAEAGEQQQDGDNSPQNADDGTTKPVNKADPGKVAQTISAFHKIGIPTEVIFAELGVKSASEITIQHAHMLKEWYGREAEAIAKKEKQT